MKKKFIVILSCGRCASTSVINFLNTDNRFNIYGENKNFIINLLNSIQSIRKFSVRKQNKKSNSFSRYHNQKYCFSEFYHGKSKKTILSIKNNLIKILLTFFDVKENFIGFKEIEWNEYNIDALSILEEFFDVKYVFLQRDMEDLLPSFKRTIGNIKKIKNCSKYIININKTIDKFLKQKNENQFIRINISKDPKFLEHIREFILK